MTSSGDVFQSSESEVVFVETDDIVQGCVKWLQSFDDITDLLGAFEDSDEPFLFQHTMQTVLEGTGKAAVVVGYAGGWSPPNTYNTLKLPRISIEIFVDPKRTDDLDYIDTSETRRRIDTIYNAVDRHLHRPQGGDQMWGTIRTVECTRLGEPAFSPIRDGDQMHKGLVYYGVMQG